jgi:hypothetical protein
MNNFDAHRGAFEVYFMGVRLFSKIESKMWPNIPALAEKCVNCYKAYVSNKEIDNFELTIKVPQ